MDITVLGTRYQGSLICPSCAQICYVSYAWHCMGVGSASNTQNY